jgi:hypothetical protein
MKPPRRHGAAAKAAGRAIIETPRAPHRGEVAGEVAGNRATATARLFEGRQPPAAVTARLATDLGVPQTAFTTEKLQ